jgi:hypothetical protein
MNASITSPTLYHGKHEAGYSSSHIPRDDTNDATPSKLYSETAEQRHVQFMCSAFYLSKDLAIVFRKSWRYRLAICPRTQRTSMQPRRWNLLKIWILHQGPLVILLYRN